MIQAHLMVALAHSVRESHWQQAWQDQGVHHCVWESPKPKYYVLEMFPYPSGELHVGHVRNYTLGDVFARYQRMQGKNVLHPMGWDALGLPAENQAIKEGVDPHVRTSQNIARMRSCMEKLGFSYDWTCSFSTASPDYYRFNQWFFLRMWEKGWVYRRKNQVNFCGECNTILANEQVDEQRVCWRGHPHVGTKWIDEWAFRITAFADTLLENLDQLSDWPPRITEQQKHWIGKSEGAQVRFKCIQHPGLPESPEYLNVFTTRLETLFGCVALWVAPDHPIAHQLFTAKRRSDFATYLRDVQQNNAVERTSNTYIKQGLITDCCVEHPYTQIPIPVYLANFVLPQYGTGIVMAVPAHDERDQEMAEILGLPEKLVILSDGYLFDSGPYTGMSEERGRKAILDYGVQHGWAQKHTSYHLRDWGFSRQRYWGTPIPVVYCPQHGALPVPEQELPIRLPPFSPHLLTGEGDAPLAKCPAFYQTTCPICQAPARRETETMDTFVDSAWYFARFLNTEVAHVPVVRNRAKTFLPIDLYVGGPEHAVMHLLYFRFWTQVMQQLGLVDIAEPAARLLTQGMVQSPAYRCAQHGYQPANATSTCTVCSTPLAVAIEKMSKSKYNGVDLPDLMQRYGADAVRLFVLFAAPPEKDLEWTERGVEGVSRFLNRLLNIVQAQKDRFIADLSLHPYPHPDHDIRAATQRCLQRATQEFEQRHHFNTIIAQLMELCNLLYEHQWQNSNTDVDAYVLTETMRIVAQILSPLAPHVAEEIWLHSRGSGLVAQSHWPEINEKLLQNAQVSIIIQVNGKRRGQITVDADIGESELIALAQCDERVQTFLAQKSILRTVVVPQRLVNFVVR